MNRIFYANITFACNNRCANCISHSVRGYSNDSLSVNDFRLIDEKFNINKGDIWNINGGEPTLSKHFPQIINFCYSKSPHIILYSNGRLISSISNNILDKIERIIIPIYGPESIHDEYVQSNGAYKETVNSLTQIIRRNPEKCEIKLLFNSNSSIQSLIASSDWPELSKNIHFSITRVLSSYKDSSPCSLETNHAAEELITKLVSEGKKVRYYDLPFCQFSQGFQRRIKQSYKDSNKLDSNVISILSNGNYKISNYRIPTSYFEQCQECSNSELCVMIMRNIFCPIIEQKECYISIE